MRSLSTFANERCLFGSSSLTSRRTSEKLAFRVFALSAWTMHSLVTFAFGPQRWSKLGYPSVSAISWRVDNKIEKAIFFWNNQGNRLIALNGSAGQKLWTTIKPRSTPVRFRKLYFIEDSSLHGEPFCLWICRFACLIPVTIELLELKNPI